MRLFSLLVFSFLSWQIAVADVTTTAERQALLQIDRDLAELVTLIEAAEQSADADARIRFRYDWLQRDIAQVRKGVQAHIYKPLADQQANVPLHNDYRR